MKNKNIFYRKAIYEDYDKIQSVIKEGQDLHALYRPDIFKSVNKLFPKKFFIEALRNENMHLLVAQHKDKICGFVMAEIKRSSTHPSNTKRVYVYISFIIVISEYRKKGIGNTLYKNIIKWSKAKGAKKLELRVWSFNLNAINIFLNNGLTEDFKQLSIDL